MAAPPGTGRVNPGTRPVGKGRGRFGKGPPGDTTRRAIGQGDGWGTSHGAGVRKRPKPEPPPLVEPNARKLSDFAPPEGVPSGPSPRASFVQRTEAVPTRGPGTEVRRLTRPFVKKEPRRSEPGRIQTGEFDPGLVRESVVPRDPPNPAAEARVRIDRGTEAHPNTGQRLAERPTQTHLPAEAPGPSHRAVNRRSTLDDARAVYAQAREEGRRTSYSPSDFPQTAGATMERLRALRADLRESGSIARSGYDRESRKALAEFAKAFEARIGRIGGLPSTSFNLELPGALIGFFDGEIGELIRALRSERISDVENDSAHGIIRFNNIGGALALDISDALNKRQAGESLEPELLHYLISNLQEIGFSRAIRTIIEILQESIEFAHNGTMSIRPDRSDPDFLRVYSLRSREELDPREVLG